MEEFIIDGVGSDMGVITINGDGVGYGYAGLYTNKRGDGTGYGHPGRDGYGYGHGNEFGNGYGDGDGGDGDDFAPSEW